MNETDIAASIERLMRRVDYYLHCELDEEYEHDRPEVARRELEASIRREILRASAVGLVSSLAHEANGTETCSGASHPPFNPSRNT